MAKRRKKKEEEEEDIDFEMPDFDREKYMKDQINEGKATLVSVAVAPLFSLVSWWVFAITEEAMIAFFAGLAGILVLKPIFETLKIKIDEMGAKGWAKNLGVYAMTLLAVWILLMNPPFSDFADPSLDRVRVELYDEHGVLIENVTDDLEGPFNITIRAKITSNTEIVDESVRIWLDDDDEKSMERDPDKEHWYTADFEYVTRGTYTIDVQMEDVNGNSNSVSYEIVIPPEE